ncbi:cytochrome c5 family protein [Vreelandella sulfidaeris]|uniref:Cytochrome c5 family protein n=1 Tax=Vreelandella sulfidaeris TaxID=115553 RepID=A0A365TM04_9GAMM|nr:c-type cytochrome [Halomonas sulfidaeris]RBI66704.1 cytochrome c5 family protein [Halomonas sulfidaeris]
MKAKLIMSGLAALGVMAGTTGAYAQDAARDAIAERLAPVGQLCLQGQDCGTAAAPASDSASSGGDIDGEGIYGNVCSACHETGAAGAPVRGNEEAWAERTEQGFATLLEHAINGIGAMPPKGGNPNLSEEEMEAATAYMVEPVMDVPELGGGDEAASEEAAPEEETAEQTAAAEDGAASEEGATAEQEVAASEDAASEEETSASDEAASGGSDLDGEALYASAGCAVCHDNGIAGAPTKGDSEAWAARLEKGADELYASAINGIGAMPPKGGNPTLADEEVMAIVDYLIAEAE